jgi:hypothetical protein
MIWHLSLSPQLVSDDDGHDFTHMKTKDEEGIQSPLRAEHASFPPYLNTIRHFDEMEMPSRFFFFSLLSKAEAKAKSQGAISKCSR